MIGEPKFRDDFIAEIRILTAEQGGRKAPAFNGIRWDFLYDGDSVTDGLFMIWPIFIDSTGQIIPEGVPLMGTQRAKMYIVNPDGRKQTHVPRMQAGLTFHCMEGPHKVACGRVVEVTGLYANAEA